MIVSLWIVFIVLYCVVSGLITLKGLLIAYVVSSVVGGLLVGPLFVAGWALEKEWEKDAQPSFFRGMIIFSCMLVMGCHLSPC